MKKQLLQLIFERFVEHFNCANNFPLLLPLKVFCSVEPIFQFCEHHRLSYCPVRITQKILTFLYLKCVGYVRLSIKLSKSFSLSCHTYVCVLRRTAPLHTVLRPHTDDAHSCLGIPEQLGFLYFHMTAW